ncbi:hypothetical protein B0H17DRAFT_1088121 [Mycena rosella]|uniref:Uncharacterized protein n=1 Tax=Mycena rosella TaxID=1033263 RepID=A0AAD7CYE1_MYCRO|nr:hypothetical protein B0H17DRAFT_1088121 [Mycena rosella]
MAGLFKAPLSHAERAVASMELSAPVAPGTRWSVPVANELHQDTQSVAAFTAQLSQQRQQMLDIESRYDYVQSQFAAVLETIYKGPRNNDSLLGRLANGHNNAMAAIAQVQQVAADSTARVAAMEGTVQMCAASMAELHRGLQILLTHDHADVPAPVNAPAPVPAPVTAPTPVAQAPSLTPVLTQVPLTAPAAVAPSDTATRMAEM